MKYGETRAIEVHTFSEAQENDTNQSNNNKFLKLRLRSLKLVTEDKLQEKKKEKIKLCGQL